MVLGSWVGELARGELGLEAAHATSVVPFGAAQLEGEDLLGGSRCYLSTIGADPGAVGLEAARDRFLYLSGSAGKGSEDPPFLQTSADNTRYSYLLPKFGRSCALDLMHADHWLHRIMDLIASETGRGA